VNVRHLTASDYVVQAWKNGGGITTQIAVGAGGDRWSWRASIADVAQSGPFSDFAGYDRIIMLMEGDGMLLSFDSLPARRIDAPFRPFAFDGATKTDCRLLGGPVRDLNLMVDRVYGRGSMVATALDGPIAPVTLHGACDLLHCAAGSVEAGVAGARICLAAGDTVRIDDGAGMELILSAPAAAATLVHMSVQTHREAR